MIVLAVAFVDPIDAVVLNEPVLIFLLFDPAPTTLTAAPYPPIFWIARLLLNLCINESICGAYLDMLDMPSCPFFMV